MADDKKKYGERVTEGANDRSSDKIANALRRLVPASEKPTAQAGQGQPTDQYGNKKPRGWGGRY